MPGHIEQRGWKRSHAYPTDWFHKCEPLSPSSTAPEPTYRTNLSLIRSDQDTCHPLQRGAVVGDQEQLQRVDTRYEQ